MKWPFGKTHEDIWLEGFSKGFEKAWDMALPIMQQGQAKLLEKVKEQTTDEIFRNNPQLKQYGSIQAKRLEMQKRLDSAINEDDKIKYHYYIEALGWTLNGHNKTTN